jgi:hypothetical protein
MGHNKKKPSRCGFIIIDIHMRSQTFFGTPNRPTINFATHTAVKPYNNISIQTCFNNINKCVEGVSMESDALIQKIKVGPWDAKI